MSETPFIYGKTVSSIETFTNREKEAEKLRYNLLHGINTMLMSPRRWGKSSLVEKVVGDISRKEKHVRTIVLDLFSVGSQEEFLERFAREVVKASSSKWEDWLATGRDFFKKLVPRLSVGVDPNNDFSLSFDWVELKKHSDEILNLPEAIAQKKKLKFVICLDEFQNLAAFKGFQGLEKKMRAAWQRQKLVTYCLYGSKRHMMEDIFDNPARPFYRFGDIMLLQKIPTSDWVSFIVKNFKKTGKQITNAHLIPQLMKNHSWYVQQLAHYTWNLTNRTATKKEVEAALEEVLRANLPFYQKEVESLSITQLNLLKAVARGERQLTSTAVMERYRLGTSKNVFKNKNILMNNDVIEQREGSFEFLDPAFEMWFKREFFK